LIVLLNVKLYCEFGAVSFKKDTKDYRGGGSEKKKIEFRILGAWLVDIFE
jgi:hypothetical protein